MQSVVCAALLIVAASAHEAFVPPTTPLRGLTKTVAPRTAPQMVAEDVPAFARDDAGITAPLGYWDPIGLAKDEETFNFYRRAELKHGRVAMLAMIGYAVPYFFKFDGWLATNPELKFADIPPGIDAVRAISAAGIAQLMFFIAFLDNIVFPVDSKYGIDVGPGFWWKGPEDPEQMKGYQSREINNGRLAMIGIMGLMVQDLVSTAPFPFTSK
ncbi:unnamed protein product [Vitrella brassicaformis CCMP3155]|uniref:Plastid light harvesting protein n=1 Tax=Vitrella brassicaformis (strain CCMP3155) TaxID=1169540 RepID=A0A0G4G849_VITBC|nr:unnamed protein product [Vitrella brassicaformis CCMP3155]|eukprot:CEM24695.1 unnamed protein product [Vitrella brassicaformis CCMP3155]